MVHGDKERDKEGDKEGATRRERLLWCTEKERNTDVGGESGARGERGHFGCTEGEGTPWLHEERGHTLALSDGEGTLWLKPEQAAQSESNF